MDSLVSVFMMLSEELIETFNVKKLNFVFNKLLNALQKFLGIVSDVNWQ
jgi:hypothetical protein